MDQTTTRSFRIGLKINGPVTLELSSHHVMNDPELEQAQEALFLDSLNKGAAVSFIARGQSMWPWISDGAQVTISPISPIDLKRGDVILLRIIGNTERQGSAWVLHRLIRRDPTRALLYTQGDRTPRPDEPWREEALLGVLTSVRATSSSTPRVFRTLMLHSIVSKPRSLRARYLGLIWSMTYRLFFRIKYPT